MRNFNLILIINLLRNNLPLDYESSPMILRSEDDEEIDIVTEPDKEHSAQQQFIAFQHHQQQHNSKLSRADCMKKLQTCESLKNALD